MAAVEVLRVLAIVADEELRAAGVLAAVGHREYAPVVALARSRGLALDRVARIPPGPPVPSPFGQPP